ncbi:MAG TPA: tetratricopeptide repeat protein [Vicinamibacteria bacterium]|nr:tetratricopeptide repeat protein [Vicinamibacteria bacterium]
MSAWSLLLAAAVVTAAPPGPSIDDELARARGLIEAGEPARAVEVVRGILPRRDTPDVRHLLGDALEAAGDLLGAAEEFQKAAHGDASEENLFDWGNSLLQLRAYVPATNVLAEAVRRFPRSARLQVGLGIVRYARGQFEDAIRAFCAAADLEPDDERPYLFLGEMYGVSAELAPEVTKRLARFVEKQPGHALGHFFYAMSLWKGTPGAAPSPEVQVHLKKAVALDPRLAKAHFQLGVLYGDEGRYPEAISALEEAVRLEPSMAQAHYRLAQAYRRTGQEERAAKALEAFGRLQPQ